MEAGYLEVSDPKFQGCYRSTTECSDVWALVAVLGIISGRLFQLPISKQAGRARQIVDGSSDAANFLLPMC
jgi:hypothetical protein